MNSVRHLGEINAVEDQPIAITIKYDGLVQGAHTIDLLSFGESLQGLSKILSTVGQFSIDGKYIRKYCAHSVKVVTEAKLSPGSIDITALLIGASSGLLGALITPLLQYILSRKDKKEMEYLAKALEQTLAQNKELAENSQKISESLLRTIERMSDGLAKANLEAMSPVGRSCGKISLFNSGESQPFVIVDKEFKDFLTSQETPSIDESNTYVGTITELDKLTGTCKISLIGDDDDSPRTPAEILDPSFRLEKNNVYIAAFSADSPISFTAKSQLDKDGNIVKFFISDANPA